MRGGGGHEVCWRGGEGLESSMGASASMWGWEWDSGGPGFWIVTGWRGSLLACEASEEEGRLGGHSGLLYCL